jgi:hypothetical protein
MKQKHLIKKFLQHLVEKNYAQANKYMEMAVAEKFKKKIRSAIKATNLF